jgi:hypothetical protein
MPCWAGLCGGGTQAILAQVHFEQRVRSRRPSQELRPVVEQVIIAHAERVERRRLTLQQGTQPDRAEVVVAHVQLRRGFQNRFLSSASRCLCSPASALFSSRAD